MPKRSNKELRNTILRSTMFITIFALDGIVLPWIINSKMPLIAIIITTWICVAATGLYFNYLFGVKK